jgi:hypothetical protein
MRSALLKILDDRFSYLVLNGKLLDSAAFGALYAERLITPVEMLQAKSSYFTASQPVDRK